MRSRVSSNEAVNFSFVHIPGVRTIKNGKGRPALLTVGEVEAGHAEQSFVE